MALFRANLDITCTCNCFTNSYRRLMNEFKLVPNLQIENTLARHANHLFALGWKRRFLGNLIPERQYGNDRD
jgi:hypothetical protein